MINNQFIYPHWPAPSKVHALSTRRAGGVSAGRYDSFNLAHHVGDNPVQVAHNRQILIDQASLPTAPHWLNQTHSTQVIEITQEHAVDNNTDQAPIDADGVVSHHSNVVCSVLTADCMPILLTNQQGSSVAAVHAGWRGMAAGILQRAIESMDADPVGMAAWLGPAIGPQAFEVGQDVYDAFASSLPGSETECFIPVDQLNIPTRSVMSTAPGAFGANRSALLDAAANDAANNVIAMDAADRSAGRKDDVSNDLASSEQLAANLISANEPGANKWFCDLYMLARYILRSYGITEISGGNNCTFHDRELFYSHRRDGALTGRMATVAIIREN